MQQIVWFASVFETCVIVGLPDLDLWAEQADVSNGSWLWRDPKSIQTTHVEPGRLQKDASSFKNNSWTYVRNDVLTSHTCDTKTKTYSALPASLKKE